METTRDVVVVGAGIAGLTAAALLARAGLAVTLLEAHHQSGGCAGTFRRGLYTFDVGATQVAGLEPGGIHERLCRHLEIPLPEATPLDPACVVDLDDGRPAISLWRNPHRWQEERQEQFPGSERFWKLCNSLHQTNWRFAGKDPVLPPRSLWDLGQLLGAVDGATLASSLLTSASMADLLRLCGCDQDGRLRRFLDLQLRLYSQEPADRTAALYGATVLSMAQEPLGLWHLEGSMQVLSTCMERALTTSGGTLQRRHRVRRLERLGERWRVEGIKGKHDHFQMQSRDVVLAIPPQTLPSLLGEQLPVGYRRRLCEFPDPSGALVLYAAVDRDQLPPDTPSHRQLDWHDPGSLFVSISQEGDGRAPRRQATVIASVFTDARPWFSLEPEAYAAAKTGAQTGIVRGLQRMLGVRTDAWLHQELATPRSFARWSGRPYGFVGGLGQRPRCFGPFGLASRTPLPGLWLCGDSIHPGEGTAGVSVSALMACRQLLAQRGEALTLES
jgi:C-3',4' desaturase CrtD